MKSLSLILAVFLLSCATEKSRDYEADELLTIYEPKWFKKNKKHTILDQTGNLQPNLFFDVSPEFTEKEQLANVIVTTMENSWLAYNVDVVSGQRYYSHSYCNQPDVWKKKSGTYGRPYFSVAYMPRVLDQLGEPQKVIIFGGAERLRASLDHHYVRVRVIGGYIEENCLEVNCLGKDNWSSRLVFVAVDPQDPNYSNIKDTNSFRGLQSWEKLQPTLQNMDGRNYSIEKSYPAIRVKRLLTYRETLQFFRNRSAFMSDKEIKKIQSGCHSLYDKLWADVGIDRLEDRPARTQEELKAKLAKREELAKEKSPVGKMERFRIFIKKYFTEAATCEKFVYHGNINLDPEHFWFHSYVGMYLRLHKEGYYFDCNRKAWAENIYNINGDAVHSIQNEIDQCTDKDLDQAMEYMPNLLKSLRGVMGRYYRFIDYDNHEFGTHRKTYSWVKMNSRKYDCLPDPNAKIREMLNIFPEEVSWKRWDIVDVEKDSKIIY